MMYRHGTGGSRRKMEILGQGWELPSTLISGAVNLPTAVHWYLSATAQGKRKTEGQVSRTK